ncbi:hypothetical protein [Yaniella flava]|uniref:hypothetical protein n=1 Tax=Yaniella flava TaxID=287930 RepID=UPI0031E2BE70
MGHIAAIPVDSTGWLVAGRVLLDVDGAIAHRMFLRGSNTGLESNRVATIRCHGVGIFRLSIGCNVQAITG